MAAAFTFPPTISERSNCSASLSAFDISIIFGYVCSGTMGILNHLGRVARGPVRGLLWCRESKWKQPHARSHSRKRTCYAVHLGTAAVGTDEFWGAQQKPGRIKSIGSERGHWRYRKCVVLSHSPNYSAWEFLQWCVMSVAIIKYYFSDNLKIGFLSTLLLWFQGLLVWNIFMFTSKAN